MTTIKNMNWSGARIGVLLVLFTTVSGCVSTGVFNAAHFTNVQLSEENYDVVARGVSGEATAGYIIGLSGALRSEMQTVALARVSGEGDLYQQAFDDLWDTFEQEHGSVEGRSLALINVRYDSDALNLILYTQPTVSIRADVIEFED